MHDWLRHEFLPPSICDIIALPGSLSRDARALNEARRAIRSTPTVGISLAFLNHARELGKDLLTADSDCLRQYMHAQAKAGMSARTAARRLSALRQLFQFLFAEVSVPTTHRLRSIGRSSASRFRI